MSSTDYLDRLNDKQKEAARYTEGPLLILAGAGSGKTSTMTCRIAYLIREMGVSPYNILAVTFTNKAAKEMRDRVESLIGSGVNMWILTFHSACLRILRRHAEVLGYGRDFAVYDPTDQKTVVKNICKELRIDTKRFNPNYFLGRISDCKESRISPEQYAQVYGDDIQDRMVEQVYRRYEKELQKNNAMDFDDLLLKTVELFEKDESVLLQYQRRFQYIMVDEYQDTNQIQYQFIKMLAEAEDDAGEKRNNICVVGDDDQCIYQWRGADIRNILEFEKDFKNTKVVKLEQNYRSTSNILDAAHSVIRHNISRKPKKLWTEAEEGDKITCRRLDNERDEAYYVASEIERLADGKYNDFAILYRTNSQSRTFEEALSRRGIPYRVLGGLRYYDRKEIKDMMCYMRLVQNRADDLALVRIINEPKRGIGGKTLDKLQTLAGVRQQSLFDVLMDRDVIGSLSAKASAGITALADMIASFSEEKDNMKISDLYDGLLVGSGYLKALEDQHTLEAESRIENLMEFKSVIYDYEKEDPNISLAEFMERIALLAEVDNHDADENAVVLMTLHSAKGLEFPFVFMPGMEDGLFPGWRSFDRPDGLEEERRLCYVGITRAKERLWMTSAETRTLYGKTDYTRESQFLREIDKTLLEGDAVYEGKKRTEGGTFRDGAVREKPYRPFDQLQYAKLQTKKRAAEMIDAANEEFAVGDRISHPKFGEGEVLECGKGTIRVRFADDTKKLALGYAAIKKIKTVLIIALATVFMLAAMPIDYSSAGTGGVPITGLKAKSKDFRCITLMWDPVRIVKSDELVKEDETGDAEEGGETDEVNNTDETGEMDEEVEIQAMELADGSDEPVEFEMEMTDEDLGNKELTKQEQTEPVYEEITYEVYRATSKKGNYTMVKSTKSTKFTNKKLKPGKKYFYRVYALNSEGEELGYSPIVYATVKKQKKASLTLLKKDGKWFNYRKAAGEKLYHYDTLQGACAYDGKAYLTLYDRTVEKCKIVKVDLATLTVKKVSKALPVYHANCLTYNTNKNLLVATCCRVKDKRAVLIDPSSLTVVSHKDISLSKSVDNLPKSVRKSYKGFTAIAYNEKRDRYYGRLRDNNNVIVMDGELNPLKYIVLHGKKEYLLNQGMDSMGNFIYDVRSFNGKHKYSMVTIHTVGGAFVGQIKFPFGKKAGNELQCIFHDGEQFYAGIYRSTSQLNDKMEYQVKRYNKLYTLNNL
ncbi:MAG: UvrD-helicase domain-containing protein [Firmicutes bacterium]|nr:UvrD-helicase domain-containing protein [Bacillota bacterium]